MIATPHTLHHPMIMRALERGLHVLCEKPLACTPEEYATSPPRRRPPGLTVTIGYQRSFDPGYTYIEASSSGAIWVSCARSPSPAAHWDEWTRSGWRQFPDRSGGGMLMDTGTMMWTLAVLAGRPALREASGSDREPGPAGGHRYHRRHRLRRWCAGAADGPRGHALRLARERRRHRHQSCGALRQRPGHPWRPGQVSLLTEEAETRPLNLQTGIDDVVMAWIAAIAERPRIQPPRPPAFVSPS